MRCRVLLIWLAVTLLALTDLVLCGHLQLHFTNCSRLVLAGIVVGGIALFYRVSGRSERLGNLAHWTLLWAVFSNAGAILTYIAAARGGPLHDATFAAIDRALGFDWTAWYDFLGPHRIVRRVLWLAYLSLMPQILGSVIYFSLRGRDQRNCEFFANNIISLLVTVSLFLWLPALGPLQRGGQPGLATLLALRRGGPLTFDLTRLQGLISFPSYHMILAVLLVWAYRRSALLVPMVLVNLVMILSIPSFGPHYLVDLLAGAAIAGFAITATTLFGAVIGPAHRHRAAAISPRAASP